MQTFHSLYELKMNLNKIEAIFTGSKRNQKSEPFPVKGTFSLNVFGLIVKIKTML